MLCVRTTDIDIDHHNLLYFVQPPIRRYTDWRKSKHSRTTPNQSVEMVNSRWKYYRFAGVNFEQHTQHTGMVDVLSKSVLSGVDNNMNWFADLQHVISVVEASCHAMQTNINDVTIAAAATATVALRKRACIHLAKATTAAAAAACAACDDDEWINALVVWRRLWICKNVCVIVRRLCDVSVYVWVAKSTAIREPRCVM